MSFSNVTKILENKINDDEMNIEETQSTPILLSTPSILVSVMNDNTFIQVLSDKLIVYTEESIIEKRFSQCIKACCNGEDILLVVKENESSNETDTMEMDNDKIYSLIHFKWIQSNLIEIGKREHLKEVTAITLFPMEPCQWCGICFKDNSVQVLSLLSREGMKSLFATCIQMFDHEITSLSFTTINKQMYLFVGCVNGVLGQIEFDYVNGEFSDLSLQVLPGNDSLSLCQVSVNGNTCLLTCGNNPYLVYVLIVLIII